MKTSKSCCPSCNSPLEQLEQGHYRCREHGEWVAYGPRLLVQAPHPDEHQPSGMLLPWETNAS